MMTPVLITPPAVEPVTLAEAKLWLRLDTTDEDDAVNRLIAAARLTVEAESGLKLNDQAWRLVMDRLPADNCIRVPLKPFRAVTAARVFALDNTPSIVPPANYAVDAQSLPGRIILNSSFPAPGRAYAGIEFDLSIGHGAAAANVPAPLRQAMLLLIAHWFENRGDTPSGAEARSVPPEIALLLSNYRRWRL